MNRHLYALVSDAIKCSGTYKPEENMSHFREHLTQKEYDLIYGFLKWVSEDERNRAFGSGNYSERYNEYTNQ